MENTTLWCVGNPLLSDDGAGPALFSQLQASPLKGATVVDCGTTPENYLAPLRKSSPKVLIVVDAAEMGLPPGSLRRMELEAIDAVSFSSHGIPLHLLLAPLKEAMKIVVIGIQPEVRGFGDGLSQSVSQAVNSLAALLREGRLDELESYQENRSPR